MQIKNEFIAPKISTTNEKKRYIKPDIIATMETDSNCNSDNETRFDLPEGFSHIIATKLVRFIKEHAVSKNGGKTPLEIERKWLVDISHFQNIINAYPAYKRLHIQQMYVSTNPELRFRRQREIGSEIYQYVVDYKSVGDLVREEYTLDITNYDKMFNPEMARFVLDCLFLPKPIIKEYHCLELPDGHRLEISLVDNKWSYVEIEYDSETEAMNYQLPDNLSDIFTEVTDNPDYKMKNYWKRR